MEKISGVPFEFSHVHIKCRDIGAAIAFYEKMFDAKMFFEEKVGDVRVAMMEMGGVYVHISEAGPEEMLESPSQPREKAWIRYGLGHFGFRVKDLDKAVRELKRKGADFVEEPREFRKGVRVAFVRGPEDDVIEISQRSPDFQALLGRKEGRMM